MRGTVWLILCTGTVAAVLSLPTGETGLLRVSKDDSERLQDGTSGSGLGGGPLPLQSGGLGKPGEDGDLQGAAGVHVPLVHTIPQLALLLQLLLLLLDVLYKSPQLLLPLHPPHGHHGGLHGGLLHTKAQAGAHLLHHSGQHAAGLGHGYGHAPGYGQGLYGVSATTSVAKGRPFGPYKYEDNQ